MEKVKKFYDLEELHKDVFQGKISRAHIYNLVKNGEIPVIKLGRRFLVSHAFVDGLFNLTAEK